MRIHWIIGLLRWLEEVVAAAVGYGWHWGTNGDMLMLNHLLILTIAPLADETSPVAFRQG